MPAVRGRTFTALVADDEPPARGKLARLIAGVAWLEQVGETATGPQTIEAVDRQRPDLLLLDVHMPGADGLEVVARLTHRPHVIFTTAHDRYAVAAFELQALDYLLKPFGKRRFHEVMERARRHLELLEAGRSGPRDPPAPRRDHALARLFVRERGRIVPVNTSDIERLEAQGDYVMIHTGEARHLVHVRMKDFEEVLDPDGFMRVHRTHIVNVSRIKELRAYDRHRLEVVLQSGARVIASRDCTKRLRSMVV